MCCSVVQPDIAKWGGLTVCSGIARDIVKSGKIFCPHYLGGGIGLLASAHLLAGVGRRRTAGGRFQRQSAARPTFAVRSSMSADGMVTLGEDPGLGIEPDLASIEQYRTA